MLQINSNDDEYRHHFGGLIALLNEQYIERSELNDRLSTVTGEIMEKIQVLLANNQGHGSQTQVSEVVMYK